MDIELGDLENILQNAKDEVLNIMGETAREVLDETIQEVLYEGEFQPTQYERRGDNGGYGDINNMPIDRIDSDTVMITNNTTGWDDAYGQRIDSIIESGIGYTWKHQPPSRPVFKITRDKLDKNKILENVARNKLESLGFEVE